MRRRSEAEAEGAGGMASTSARAISLAPRGGTPGSRGARERQHRGSSNNLKARGQVRVETKIGRACEALIDRTNLHLRHLVSGATASVVARTLLAPLERVKVELQINQRPGGAVKILAGIVKGEGVAGLWRGNTLNLLRTVPYRSLNYYTYDNTRALMLRGKDGELSVAQRLVCGATAGCVAILCCFPLDVLRTRMLRKGNEAFYKRGALSTLAHIVRAEGPLALYSGVIPALVSIGPSNAVFYATYDALRSNHLRMASSAGRGGPQREEKMDPKFSLLYGGLAGIVAETSVYPLEVLRRRLQLATVVAATGRGAFGNLRSMSRLLRVILAREGLRGLYAGALPTVCQVLPSAAISYYIFEEAKKTLRVHK